MLRVESSARQVEAQYFRAPPNNNLNRVSIAPPPQGPVDTDGCPKWPDPSIPGPYPHK